MEMLQLVPLLSLSLSVVIMAVVVDENDHFVATLMLMLD